MEEGEGEGAQCLVDGVVALFDSVLCGNILTSVTIESYSKLRPESVRLAQLLNQSVSRKKRRKDSAKRSAVFSSVKYSYLIQQHNAPAPCSCTIKKAAHQGLYKKTQRV